MTKNNSDWIIHKNNSETKKIASDLALALKEKDYQKIISLLSSPMNTRSLVVRRGIKSEYLKLLLETFNFLLKKEYGANDLAKIKGTDLINFLHSVGLPEKLLYEILAIAFHKRDEKLFRILYEIIMNNQEKLTDKEIVVATMNAEGAWLGSVENNHSGNLETNKKALAMARKYKLEVMECKLIFALSDHKAYREEKKLKPKNQIEDYRKLSKKFLKLGIDYDALRADIELAFCYLSLAKKQTGAVRESNLNKALTEAKKAQEKARRMEYPNALIRIKNILSEIYKEKNNKIQAARYLREVKKLKEKYL